MQHSDLPPPLLSATPISEYLDAVGATVSPLGFAPDQTLAAVSICRDELTQHLMIDVERRWGPPFALGGLGGLPSLGRTGWGACLSHVPSRSGRGKLLVLGLPHIGVTPGGDMGSSLRRRQAAPTATCGALCALQASWGREPEAPVAGLADHEAEMLRRLVGQEADGNPADILAFTLLAAAAVKREMSIQLEALAPWQEMDVALFIGIQVHMPEGPDHVLALTASQYGAEGQSRALDLVPSGT